VTYAASSAVKSYREYKEELAKHPPPEEAVEDETKAKTGDQSTADKQQAKEEPQNIFAKWFGVGVGSKYYEGGFEETMTRREAALILGVRESASAARIKEAHRKVREMIIPE
jgi:hypothetical protein